MITTVGLTKQYGPNTVVDGVNLTVAEGGRYGLLGPNGSGKSTLIRMLLGLVFATRGEITMMGASVPRHVGRVLPRVGALVEGPAAYGHLSGRRNLELLDAAGPGGPRRTRAQRVDDALDQVGLGGVDGRPVKAYSLGMRQRLGLAGALLRRPDLVILDEPTNGLDPLGIREFRDLLVDLNAAGTTVLLSSHLLAEVELLCTRVGVMDRGRLVLQSDVDRLRTPTGRVMVALARRRPGRGDAGRAGGGTRRRPADDSGAGAGRAQRTPRRRRPAGGRDGCRAPHAGGRRAGGHPPGLGQSGQTR